MYQSTHDTQSRFLLGLPCTEFQGLGAAPCNEARLCGLLKEIPAALFHDPKLMHKNVERSP